MSTTSKPCSLPSRPQQLDIAGATRAEPEVAPAQHDLGVQGADQHALDEQFGRLVGRERPVERRA